MLEHLYRNEEEEFIKAKTEWIQRRHFKEYLEYIEENGKKALVYINEYENLLNDKTE